jgi:hypothetical protein
MAGYLSDRKKNGDSFLLCIDAKKEVLVAVTRAEELTW